MCGFIVDINGSASETLFLKARDTLIHRGPDGYGFLSINNVRMGHRRLGITGLCSPQPIVKNDFSMCFNGEIYDYQNHRKRLEQKGYIFETDGDTEVFLTLIQDGFDLNGLRGEFSSVIFDKKKNKIYAIRDAFGVKPLLWMQKGNEFVFASEAKAILELGYERAWNKNALKQIVSVQYTWNETIFANIKEIPAGHILELDITTGNYSIYKWFQYKNETILPIKDAIELSVKRRLQTPKKYAMHLSGGIDSAIICALASRITPIETYTVAFDGNWSEASKAQKIAKHCGVNNILLEVNHSDMLSALPDALYYGEGIAINGHIGAKYLLNKKIHEDGFKINLSGEGSDELFLGYPFFREDYFRSQNDLQNLLKLKKDNMYLDGHMMSCNPNQYFGWLRAKTEFGNELQLATQIKGFTEEDYNTIPGFEYEDDMKKSIESWRNTCLSGYILKTLADGQEMAHSIEGRPPFLDRDVAVAADFLSYKERLNGEYDKQILRDTFKDILPQDIVYQKKHPFASPPLDKKSENLIQEYLNDKDFINFFPGELNYNNIKQSTVKMAVLSLGLLGKEFKLEGVK